MDKLVAIRLRPLVAERLRDRQVGHQVVMKALPDDLGPSPRAAAHCLWFAREDILTIQTDKSVRSDLLGELVRETPLSPTNEGDILKIEVGFSCLKTPPADVPEELRPILKSSGRAYRSRSVVVPEADRPDWATRKLVRHGFTPQGELSISPLAYASLGRRGGRIPYVEVSCLGTVTDAAAFNHAVTHGIGKGKSFGLGLVRFSSASRPTHA